MTVSWLSGSRDLADGELRPVRDGTANAKGRRKSKRTVVSRKEAKAMRPERTEVLIFTARLPSRSGKRVWGTIAASILAHRHLMGSNRVEIQEAGAYRPAGAPTHGLHGRDHYGHLMKYGPDPNHWNDPQVRCRNGARR